jgi:hypothetical protein
MKFLLFLSLFFLNFIYADVYVSGYTRSNGTYVSGHYRSSPNHTKSDNFSTYGNVNPYTGKIGTKTYYDYNNYGRSSSNSGSTSSSHSNTYSSDYDSDDSKNIDEEVARILSSIKSRSSQSKNILLKGKYSFQVKVVPSNARVQIMNIKTKFYNGIKLKEGSYRIRVSKKGYITSDKWIKLERDRSLNITLKKNNIYLNVSDNLGQEQIKKYSLTNVNYVSMTPNNANYITMGSSKDDVLSVQGTTPKAINKYLYSETWRYGDYSTIEFKGNKVNELMNNGALNVK